MKHLSGCFESQSFSWSVIQSVLNHSKKSLHKSSTALTQAL
jgi:hypothetical protein